MPDIMWTIANSELFLALHDIIWLFKTVPDIMWTISNSAGYYVNYL